MNSEGEWSKQREVMVRQHLQHRGIRDPRVLSAMSAVPREAFVPLAYRASAYLDAPLPIDRGQSISQPYIVALMTEALRLVGGERVLEIGTGSGYQTAVLAEVGALVWTIERDEILSQQAAERLWDLAGEPVHFIQGDGTLGWPAAAPYDGILATGSLPEIPRALLRQLRDGGVFVGPVGGWHAQDLVRVVYHGGEVDCEVLCHCRFVPLIGEEGWDG